MSDIKEGFLPEKKGSSIRKRKGRPKSADPKMSVTLTLRRSTVSRLCERLTNGQTVASVLSAAVEAKYGLAPAVEPGHADPRLAGSTDTKGARPSEVTPRLKDKRGS